MHPVTDKTPFNLSHQDHPPKPAQPWLPDYAMLGFLLILITLFLVGTLRMPLDFNDDGNAAYSAVTQGSFQQHLTAVGERTRDDFHARGPFRPVFWGWYQVHQAVFGEHIVLWRASRLLTTLLTAGLCFYLLRRFRVAQWSAVAVTVLVIMAPGCEDVWIRFAFGEGIAMPLALLALVAADKAVRSSRPWSWDLLGFLAIIAAIWIKNVFVAVLAAQLLLRLWPEGKTLREGLRCHWRAGVLLALVAVVPLAHLLLFAKTPVVHEEYQLKIPGPLSVWYMLAGILVNSGVLFLLPAVIVLLMGLRVERTSLRLTPALRRAGGVGLALLLAGSLVYLPLIRGPLPGRYSMPASLGLHILLAVGLTYIGSLFVKRHRLWTTILATTGVILLTSISLYRQDVLVHRTRELWSAMTYLQHHAPSHASISAPTLTPSERYHMQAHLANRGRGDLIVQTERAGSAITLNTPHHTSSAVCFSEPIYFWNWLPRMFRLRHEPTGIEISPCGLE